VNQPTPTVDVSQPGTVTGTFAYQNAPDNAGINVQLMDAAGVTQLGTAQTDEAGSFRFDGVPVGEYVLIADASQSLTVAYALNITEAGAVIELASMTLPSGDADDNEVVDLLDAGLIGANFGVDSSLMPAADLNRDSLVDVRDLVLVGINYGTSGPVILDAP
jgi:hypothetical protein